MPAVGVTRSPQARARSSLSRKDSGVHRCLMDVSPPRLDMSLDLLEVTMNR